MVNAQTQATPPWLQALSRAGKPLAIGSLVIALALVVAAFSLGILYGRKYAPEVTGCVLAAPFFFGTGLWRLLREEGPEGDVDATRVHLLIVGAGTGLALLTDTVVRVGYWWDYLIGGFARWNEEGKTLLWFLILVGPAVAGLAVMFAALLLGRAKETSDPVERRLFYGYNALLVIVLVMLILLVVNVVGYARLDKLTDWTAVGMYTLSPQAQNVLKGLDKPVTVYVIVNSRGTAGYDEIMNLMGNCAAVTDRFRSDVIVRSRDLSRHGALMRKYHVADEPGLLVVVGTEGDEQSQFIKMSELFEGGGMMGRREEPVFRGEDALIATINYLEEGKNKPVVYFTQGRGELDVANPFGRGRPETKAGTLKARLEKANYEVKALYLGLPAERAGDRAAVSADKVPDDAAAVVIAGPTREFSPEAVKALREYANRKAPEKKPEGDKKEDGDKKSEPPGPKPGRLVVMLGVVPGPDGKMMRTGLEPFLQEFDVEATNDRILRPVKNNPARLRVAPDDELLDRNPVASALYDPARRALLPVEMTDVRMIRPKAAGRPGQSAVQAEVLLMTVDPPVWPESDLRDPQELVNDLTSSPERAKEVQKKLALSLPAAVAVSEGGMPFNPHQRGGGQKPKMVVFGNATFVSDAALAGGRGRAEGGDLHYSLVAGSLAWLRERPQTIGIPPKKRDVYTMQENTDLGRMIFMPAFLLVVGIIGLGMGVYFVRRR
ncbi:MAG TPA: Gldg family protein [Gemmataceae bacterium]|nr:Gldg family protein [Gemmataceae bacterium]